MQRSLTTAGWRLALPLCLLTGCAGGEEEGTDAADVLDIPERPFAAPTGPHPIGMIEVLWEDTDRMEPFTKDPTDIRNVAARIWYPSQTAGPGDAPYVPDMKEFGTGQDFAPATHVKTNATLDAPVSLAGPFPVLIYNHGGGWTRFTSTFTTEELASHGYVVISIGHNGFNKTQFLPNGSSVNPDTLSFPDPTGNILTDAYVSWDYLDQHHFPMWVGDVVHALDRLVDLNTRGPLSSSMDLANIGMYGWSFGGAASIEAAVIDERVKAAVNHDGQLFGSAPTTGTSRPFMLMHGGEVPEAPSDNPEESAAYNAAIEELLGAVRNNDASLKTNSTGPWYDLTINGANHGNFSDLALLLPASSPGIEPGRAHSIINALTLSFFNRYLKGTESPLLDDPTGQFPEVTFEKRLQN